MLNKITTDVTQFSHIHLDHYQIYLLKVLRFLVIFIVFFRMHSRKPGA